MLDRAMLDGRIAGMLRMYISLTIAGRSCSVAPEHISLVFPLRKRDADLFSLQYANKINSTSYRVVIAGGLSKIVEAALAAAKDSFLYNTYPQLRRNNICRDTTWQ